MDFSGKPAEAASLYVPSGHRWGTDPQLAELLQLRSATQSASATLRTSPLHCRLLLADQAGSLKSPVRLRTTTVDKASGKVTRGDHAAVIETTYGKGKVSYLPFDLTWMYFRYDHAHLARLLEWAVRDAASGPPPVEVKAPSIVQSMLHTQGDRLIVHLVNDLSSFGRSQNVVKQTLYERREVIPIHDIALTICGERPRRVFLMPGKLPLAPIEVKDVWQVALPPLEVHAMVVVER